MPPRPLSDADWSQIVRPGNRIFIASGAGVPFAVVDSMLKHATQFIDVELVHMHTFGGTPWVDQRFDGCLRTNTFFLTPEVAAAVATGHADYTPCPISDIPRLFRGGDLPVDVALIQVSPPDAQGMVSLGVSVDVAIAAMRSAKRIVAQINPKMPHTRGAGRIAFTTIDYYLEAEAELPEMEKLRVDHRHDRIANYTAQLIEDGACLQVSLGNTPQHVLSALGKHQNLGIHTGILTEAFWPLIEKGVVTNSQKRLLPGKAVASHAYGSSAFYQFLHQCRDIEFHPSDWVNDPMGIAKNPKVVAINGAMEIDLTGQVVRDSRGHRYYGGIGAIQDFVRGAGRSKGGRPIVVLTSTHDEVHESRIVSGLAPGSGVCTSRGDVHFVVTEFGVASLHGRSIRERVLALTDIAHPDFRESLLAEARAQGKIPKTFTSAATSPTGSEGAIESKALKINGKKLVLRPLHPSDMRSLQDFFYSHDPETVRLRFGHQKERMNSTNAYKLVAVDQTKDLALGLFERVGGRSVLRAIARYYLETSGEAAEVAFVVHEDFRRCGIARRLMNELAKVAKRRGVKRFWASVLKVNKPMAGLFLAHGATRESHYGDDADEYWMNVAQIIQSNRELKQTQNKRLNSKPIQRKMGVLWDEIFLKHQTGEEHPESVARYQQLLAWMRKGVRGYKRIPIERGTPEQVLMVHETHYYDIAKYDIENLADTLRTGDTSVCPDSFEVAMQAVGAVVTAVKSVLSGKFDRVFCATRPPGHHATPSRGMGFCIFNHLAIGAKYALERGKLKRVAIIDWDVHHGNGTQEIFENDPRVLFFSTHEQGLYPYTGAPTGDPLKININLRSGAGDAELMAAWKAHLEPALASFKPQLIFISAGFDARKDDPIGGLEMTDAGFSALTKLATEYAETYCNGRLISVLEGGYNPTGLALAVRAHLSALKA